MKTVQILSAAVLFAATATGAFASEFDGKADNAWLVQTPVSQSVARSQSAPAPAAAAATEKSTEQTRPAAQASFNNAAIVP